MFGMVRVKISYDFYSVLIVLRLSKALSPFLDNFVLVEIRDVQPFELDMYVFFSKLTLYFFPW